MSLKLSPWSWSILVGEKEALIRGSFGPSKIEAYKLFQSNLLFITEAILEIGCVTADSFEGKRNHDSQKTGKLAFRWLTSQTVKCGRL